MNEEKNVILSLKNVHVKFNVRGRILTAIRDVSLDIYEHESLAIVGESGSGKSVLTKTFAGMLDSNGFISNGSIVFKDDDLSKTDVTMNPRNMMTYKRARSWLDKFSALERGSEEYGKLKDKKNAVLHRMGLSLDEEADFNSRKKELSDDIIDKNNYLWTLDKKADHEEFEKTKAEIESYKRQLKELSDEIKRTEKSRLSEYKIHPELIAQDKRETAELKAEREKKIAAPDVPVTKENPYGLTEEKLERNDVIAKEIVLSIGRYAYRKQLAFMVKLKKAFRQAMTQGEDLSDPETLNKIFEVVAFRVQYRSYDEKTKILHGYAIIDCAKIKLSNDWQQIRGRRIATVFQDPMTSLNPVITIGKQIMTVILKHQKCSKAEAKKRTIDIMEKVGIPDPAKRFDDYPFEYSGGMRQRIVIAIALSCQPRILICDEPTTALDVTIQAQILNLIKDLQRDLGFTTVYITHDLGVVANVAERVAVLYAGQIVELGTVEEIFYEPRHPYTWALLSALPQLAEKGDDLFSIPGTPPSLYNVIKGDAFAQRSEYAMAIDLVEEPPMFKISDTHYAKTWLLDPRAPKTDPPKIISDLHEKIKRTFVSFDEDVERAKEKIAENVKEAGND